MTAGCCDEDTLHQINLWLHSHMTNSDIAGQPSTLKFNTAGNVCLDGTRLLASDLASPAIHSDRG